MLIAPGSALYYLILLLIVGNFLALLVGVMMVVTPKQLAKLSKVSNRWVSTRKMTKPLETPRSTDRAMLRYPRLLGGILLASAVLILVKGIIFISGMSLKDGGKLLARFYSGTPWPSAAWETLWLGLISLIILGALLAVVVGLLSIYKVQKLRHWTSSANRWFSTRRASKPFDVPHYHLDKMVREKPQVWGSTIIALALYSVVLLWWFVLRA